jgi:ATP-dependent DNA ligase
VFKSGRSVKMYTRTLHRLDEKFPELVEEFVSSPIDFVLDGELGYLDRSSVFMWPVLDFNATMRVVGSGVEEALRKQDENLGEDGSGRAMKFWAFDLLWCSVEGTLVDQSQAHRTAALWRHRNKIESYNVELIVQHEQFEDSNYQAYVERGGEGVILKNPRARYVPGKRPANVWYKLKKYDTIDVRIIGYKRGQGKYEDQIGSIEWQDTESTMTGFCSGMADEVRADITENASKYLGRAFEMRHFGAMVDGVRFPQFLRWRDDKS